MDTAEPIKKTSWIQKIWPIQKFELKKILPLLSLKFLVSFAYAILTCMKDPLVVTAEHSGAEIIPVLKGWLVFPLSIVAALVYSKLSNVLKRSTLFYGIISFFMIIIFIYGFLLYPNSAAICPNKSADWLTAHFGSQYSHWISVYRNWFHSLFFITAELWGQIVIFLLYWGFANHICQLKEAKRTYTLFIAAGDVGTILTGPLVLFFIKKYSGADFTPTLQALICFVLGCAALMMIIYWWMNRYVLVHKRYYDPTITKQSIEQKTKLSLYKSIKHICSSRYLLCIAVLVIGCALSINMIEVTWKANLKIQYPNIVDYQAFIGKLTTWIGSVALVTVLFLGGSFLRIFGWRFSAQITPIAVGATGVIFFMLYSFQDYLGPITKFFGLTPLMLIIFFGAFQNIISKVVKYSFFDSTKEMAYIPLDQESKVKGKAAIDMVGSRLGKSGSSWLQLALMQIAGTGSILVITPYLIPIVIAVTLYWSYSVHYLNKEIIGREEEAEISKKTSIKPQLTS